MSQPQKQPSLNRQIWMLALPALGALLAEPLFLLADSAMVGHLGATELAGLAVATTILTTVVGLMIFLAYSTTPLVARRLGAGNPRGAVQAGIDGVYLAGAIGILCTVLLFTLSRVSVAGFTDPAGAVGVAALEYLQISALGVPGMLLVYAGTGLERGMQNTLTPLLVSIGGFGGNIALNWILIYGCNLGIAGSAWGTVIAQWTMALALLVLAGRRVRAHGATWRPQLHGIKASSSNAGWFFLRTLALRVCIILAMLAATKQGEIVTAGFQAVTAIFTLLTFILDSLGIAAQALIGKTLGAGSAARTKLLLNRMLLWGVLFGCALGVAIAVTAPLLGYLFSSDPAVLTVLPLAFLVLAVLQPLAGAVFVLDGVLIGAGDSRYLGIAGLVNLAIYAPYVLYLNSLTLPDSVYLPLNVAGYMGVFMCARLLTLGWRARGETWLRVGADTAAN